MNSPKPYIYTDNNFNTMDDYAQSILRLKRPEHPVDVVLDTDPYNEVDDQFALAYLLQWQDRLRLKGIYAAPFFNHHSKSPADGMEKSYEEVFHVLSMLNRQEFTSMVYRGAPGFLKNEESPVKSPATEALHQLAMQYSSERPLYIIGIAACTNIASTLLLHPEIKERIFVIWLGGMSYEWHDNASFNAGQDIAAARVLLGSGVPLILIPGRGVLDHFTTTGPEMEYWLRGKNTFCDYILDKTAKEASMCSTERCWSRPISDVAAVAWLLGQNFMLDRLEHSPIMQYDNFYSTDKRRPFIRYVYSINRDKLMSDLFKRLSLYE
ncbi:MAG: nucleoside hydrolase [Hungatella sp.]|jgi:inosine-uridine nucleoside N-ribohydrolase|nr:nucleoside hydrolase [Hungatella sp.]